MTRRASTFGVAALVFTLLVSHPFAQQQPVFRTGVEVTTLDVSVVDDDGRPVVDLKPNEFRVRVDGKDRRVVSAEWIPLTSSRASAELASPPSPPAGYSTNATPTRGRLLLLAVDQPNIRFAGTQLLRSSLNQFIDGLEPADRAAAVALGQGGASTGFTADKEAVKRAISAMAGSRRALSEFSMATQHQIGMAEAFDIVDGNTEVLRRVWLRECLRTTNSAPLPNGTDECVEQLKLESFRIQTSVKSDAQESLTALRSLLDSLKRIDAPKTLVMVTDGFPVIDQPGIFELGTLAAAAKTSLYILKLTDQPTDASNQSTPGSQALNADRMMLSQGAELLASVTKGEVFNIFGTGRPAVERLEREVSGYYLVGVESAPADSDGRAHPISVQVSRPRTIVRARREHVEVAENRRARDAGDPVADAIRSPLLANGLTLLVTASVVRDEDPARVRLLLSADVGSGYTAAQEVRLAYLITDSKDREVVNKAAHGRLPLKPGDKSPLTFTAEESVPPGDYVWKLVIADGTRVGSVEHAIHTGPIGAVPARPEAMTSAAGGGPPAARPAAVNVAPRPFRREDATAAEVLKKFEAGVAVEGRTAFNQGIAALASGNYAAAEAGFREALQSGFAGGKTVAPMTYLGATFAASGRDAEAIGIWQVALTDGSAFAQIYDWLAEALLRTKDLAQARGILREAAEKWPADARFATRLAELSPAGATR